ncbi:DUF6689 family protein [Novilysobacter arseniciresistens]|uniref:DUF6689 family protein n=1 Tax=Novilysobacter arseniciresistens TaxID=1385522 RepID=UPI00068B6B39|nr:DUF6689 family protein [Lysobacter arseniciresistens]
MSSPRSKLHAIAGALLTTLLALAAPAAAQSLPVTVNASGNTATATVGLPGQVLADLTITFDEASGLSASSLGVSARLVDLSDPTLLARLPDLSLVELDSALPLMITIEPPPLGGLAFHRTARVEVHTHLLDYAPATPYRLIKAPLGGAFRDITSDVSPGSVRARGTTGGFSQFLVVADLRETGSVIDTKFHRLRGLVDGLPVTEQPAFRSRLDAAEAAVRHGDYPAAMAALDAIRAHAAARAGTGIEDEWRAAGGSRNDAGEIIAGAETLQFSIAFLRDYGQ